METFKFDISDAFQALKESLKCKSCNKLETTASFLIACGHQVCTICLSSNRQCPICKTSFTKKDIIKRDDCLLPIINKINSIEAKLATQNYKIDELPSEIFDGEYYRRKSRNRVERENAKPIVIAKEQTSTKPNLKFVCDEISPNFIRIVENTGKRNSKGETQLHTLARRGKLKDLKEIINKGADVNAVDWTNWTPLHEAVQAGALECAQLLLQSGALVNVPGDNYDTPLHSACESNNFPMVKLLLSYGANISAKNFFGQTPMNISGSDVQQVLLSGKTEMNINPIYYIDKNQNVFVCDISQETKNLLANNKYNCNSISPLKDAGFCVIGNEVKLDKMEILLIILKGIMVLQEKDLAEYLTKEQLIQPSLIPEKIRPAVLNSLKNRLKRFPKLFDRLNFHVIGHHKPIILHDTKFSKSDIMNLIKEGDGKILVRSPTEATAIKSQRPFHTQQTDRLVECSNFIVYNKMDAPLLMYNMNELRHVSSEWIIECIRQFKITNTH